MSAKWPWRPKQITRLIKKLKDEPKKKFFFTDSKDEFLRRMEIIAIKAFETNKDNLRFLERMEQIRQVRGGVDIKEVYPWLKKDMEC